VAGTMSGNRPVPMTILGDARMRVEHVEDEWFRLILTSSEGITVTHMDAFQDAPEYLGEIELGQGRSSFDLRPGTPWLFTLDLTGPLWGRSGAQPALLTAEYGDGYRAIAMIPPPGSEVRKLGSGA
jgi:hypothetical protein